MTHNNEYTCIHEKQIQGQSRKLERVEARLDYKDETLHEMNKKIEKLDENMSKVLEVINELKIQSKHDDKELELRLKAIETELEIQKQTLKNNQAQASLMIAIVTVLFTILTFFFNFTKIKP